MTLKALVGSGDRIGLFTLPFLVVGMVFNVLFPSSFSVGGPPPFLKAISAIVLIPGVIVWIWSVALILTKVPRGELITNGPFSIVRHPLYTGVSLLVLPWVGFLADTWLGAVMGVILYLGSRLFSPDEEAILAHNFGSAWEDYRDSVKLPWL